MQELQFDRISNSNLKQLLATSIINGKQLFSQGRDHSLEGNLKSKFEEEFIKETKLGQGYTGVVYKCLNRIDNIHYAVKISTSKFRVHVKDSSPRIEAKILAKLFSQNDNKYIVKYYDCWCEGKDFYLVTELCDSNIRSMGTFQEFEIKCLLRDVLQGLQFLHKKELAHMDIKPENILFKKSQYTYKLADFGISRFKEISDDEVRGGDSRYQAPEIMDNLNDRRSLDLSKTDIFSLGCVIYELMANTPIPIQKIQTFKITDKINLDSLNFSDELKCIFRQMVVRDPRNRPSAEQLLQSHYLNKNIDNQIKYLQSSIGWKYD